MIILLLLSLTMHYIIDTSFALTYRFCVPHFAIQIYYL